MSNSISRLAVISDEQASHLVSAAAHADLAESIMAADYAGRPGRQPARTGWRAMRRRWMIGVPAVAALAAAALVATSLGSPGDKLGPVSIGPAKAQAALVFTRHGHYIDVIVRNPLADPRRYRAEFRAHHLDVTLKLVPASPSIVGTVVYFGGTGTSAIKVITAKERCITGGGGSRCPVGLRVPVNFRGQADLVFGRAARPGERYESTTTATAPGEALHGLTIRGLTVRAAVRLIGQRHVTVPVFHVTSASGLGAIWPASKVPGNWYVYDADPWAPGQVMLWVGRSRVPHQPQPSPGTPVPSPAPASAR
ncbi:MAG TPA: hypothetical protein VF834_05770 [Streptosporangiaceae bacterium]